MSSNNRILSEWKDVPMEQFIKLSAGSAFTKNGDLRLQNIPLYNLSINRATIGLSILDEWRIVPTEHVIKQSNSL
jgi:hypothetical protein